MLVLQITTTLSEFNIMRLLDKLGVDYKENIINTPETGLHKYLEKYMNTLPSQVNKK